MNGNILKAQMKLNNDTQNDLAEYLGISKTTLSYKTNGKTDFSREEIRLIKERYDLEPDEVDKIFFN